MLQRVIEELPDTLNLCPDDAAGTAHRFLCLTGCVQHNLTIPIALRSDRKLRTTDRSSLQYHASGIIELDPRHLATKREIDLHRCKPQRREETAREG